MPPIWPHDSTVSALRKHPAGHNLICSSVSISLSLFILLSLIAAVPSPPFRVWHYPLVAVKSDWIFQSFDKERGLCPAALWVTLLSIVGWQGSIEEWGLRLIASPHCMDREPDKNPIQHDTRVPTPPKQASNLITRGEAGKRCCNTK